MQTQWFNNLPKSEQEDFKKTVLASQVVVDRLKEMCYNKIKNEEVSDYDTPSWAYKQADRNGYVRAYKELITLLTFSDKETN